MLSLHLALTSLASCPPAVEDPPTATSDVPRSVRMVDLDGDDMLDRLVNGPNGELSILINRGERQFAPIVQQLPNVVVAGVYTGDLNGDAVPDLYLVSPGANAALVGDGTGSFVDATEHLGLTDFGRGRDVERLDVDGDGTLDLLLHNEDGDVVFWGIEGGGFERDAATPHVQPVLDRSIVYTRVRDANDAGDTDEASEDASGSSGTRGGRRAVPTGTVLEPRQRANGDYTTIPTTLGTAGLFGPNDTAQLVPTCFPTIRDHAGGCLEASSVPSLGRLYPISSKLFVGTGGRVGMGTTSPAGGLHVANQLDTELWVSPNTSALNLGTPSLFLSEGDVTRCGWRFLYDGADTNELRIISECTNPATRLSINRSNGIVLIGGEDSSTGSVGPGLLRVNGDVSQDLSSDGLVKAAAHIDGTGTVSVTRSFNNLPGGTSITVSHIGTGLYEVDFGVAVTGRFYQGTIGAATAANRINASIEVTPRSGNANALFVDIEDNSGSQVDNDFFLQVY